ncbi:glycosyltransferase involved in cell wall biosynthesis [Mesonia hippocampi]|uniref:Glycosyltransferase involved in cell wall biosynthesis n=1 Tax=Mesonia hippocampi TaxID=1628250 RepID=A0A840ESD9_9FLAO|nr:glycosyltransferase family 2 protein [Mesonia hippocampi]MBB4119965.1 glycosyltransferase involved in cell wall biosynthesis [Mesonia hippocampi]
MRFYIIIPAHNEALHLQQTLTSLVSQRLLPTKILIVNDNSTDNTEEIAKSFSEKYPFIDFVNKQSSPLHLPGSKVIEAFNYGLSNLDDNYDILCKFDADLIFPENYLETLSIYYKQDDSYGMIAGFCYIKKDENWVLENLTDKEHIRGALKSYRKACFNAINGLEPAMGWDTADELKAMYFGWKIKTLPNLHVKHLRPTGATYNKKAKYKQGEAFYRLRYGFLITFLAAVKLAVKKGNFLLIKDYLLGYFKAKQNKMPRLVSSKQGKWIRAYRWKKIKQKLF